jgi:hypothetical protein
VFSLSRPLLQVKYSEREAETLALAAFLSAANCLLAFTWESSRFASCRAGQGAGQGREQAGARKMARTER